MALRNPGARSLTLSIILATCVLGACSPYVYKREINAFATGVETVAGAHGAALAEAERLRLAEQRRQWVVDRAQLAITAGCLGSANDATPQARAEDGCALLRGGGHPSAPTNTEIAARDAIPIAQRLSAYAGALKAIINAEDRNTFDAASSELTSAIGALSPETSRPQISAAGGLFSALFGAYLDSRRLSALRTGVAAARPNIRLLAPRLGESLEALRHLQIQNRNANVARILNELNQPRREITEEVYLARLGELETETVALEALRVARPQAATAGLVTAHEALADALADDSRQTEAVIAAIQQFSEQVEKVDEAFD